MNEDRPPSLLDRLDHAPVPPVPLDHLLKSGRAARRRQRRTMIVSVVAAVALVAGTGSVASQTLTSDHQETAPPADTVDMSTPLSDEEVAIAEAAARQVVAEQFATITSATVIVQPGTTSATNTGRQCTSDRELQIRLIGTFPFAVVSGYAPGPTGPWPGVTVRAMDVTVDADTGLACLIGVRTGESGTIRPLPGSTVLPPDIFASVSPDGTAATTAEPDGERSTRLAGAVEPSAWGELKILPPENRASPLVFSGTSADGTEFNVTDLRGDIGLIYFWGSWCAPCLDDAVALSALERTTGTSVDVLGVVSREASPTAFQATETDLGVTFPSIFNPDEDALEALGDLRPHGYPTTLILDRDGRVAASAYGALDSDDSLNAVIETLSAEPTDGLTCAKELRGRCIAPARPANAATRRVPDIERGDSFAKAVRMLRRVGLRFEATNITAQPGGSFEQPYRVVSVHPSPGARVTQSQTITIRMKGLSD